MSQENRSHPLYQLVIARLREFWREPAIIFWVYGFPLIMALALGLAFRSRPVAQEFNVDIAQAEEQWTQQVHQALKSDDRLDVTLSAVDEWESRLRNGATDLVIVHPDVSLPGGLSEEDPDSTADSAQSGTDAPDSDPDRTSAADGNQDLPRYRVVFDPTRPGNLLARDAVDQVLQIANGRANTAVMVSVEYSKPGGRYIDFLIPGLLGMSLMGGGLWGVGFAIVDMRIRKLLKRFVATPMKRWHFLAGVMISRMIFMIPEMVLLIVFARVFFGVMIHGNLLTVGLLIFLGAMQFSGIGLLIACRVKTMESVSGLMNLTMLPMWIGSGIFFKSENFPDFMQPAINCLPLTPLIRSMRTVMLEGTQLTALGPDLAAIVIWGIATFALALFLFRWN